MCRPSASSTTVRTLRSICCSLPIFCSSEAALLEYLLLGKEMNWLTTSPITAEMAVSILRGGKKNHLLCEERKEIGEQVRNSFVGID
jgi:hypothetical protein